MIYMIVLSFLATIVATLVGGAISFFVNKINKRIINFLNNFCLGLIIGFLFLELFKESIDHFIIGVNDNFLGTLYSLIIIFGVGVIFYALHELLHRFSKHHDHDKDDKTPCLDHAHIHDLVNDNKQSFLNNFIFVLAILIHNIPEGLTLGVTFNINNELPIEGIIMASVLFVHNLIIGFAMSNSIKQSGKNSAFKILFAPFIASLIAFVFALIGYFISNLNISELFNGIMLSISSGSLLYVLFIELIPQNYYQYKDRFSFIFIVFGIVISIFLVSL